MRFVFNQEKNDEMREILMMRPTTEEARTALDRDDTDPSAWYAYGTALSLEKRYDEAIEAHSRGIAFGPFYPPNYFGRGRRHSISGHFWQAVADFSVAIQLEPSNWMYWYYRATCLTMNGHVEEAISDFRRCLALTRPEEHYPLIDWLYTSNVELGRYDEAEEALKLTDASADCPQMDYGYKRSVLLYKGVVPPEEFIDLPLLQQNILPQPNRLQLELNGLYYSLYCFYMVHGQPDLAADAIRELQKVAYPGAFAYTKSIPIARRLGIIKD